MKKLEDIPKETIFKTPEGYFDKLPGVIQSRVAKEKTRSANTFSYYAVRYALPVGIIMAALIIWFRPNTTPSPEGMLAAIDTQDLVTYLRDDEVTLDDLLDQVTLDDFDAHRIQQSVYTLSTSDSAALESVLEEMTELDSNSL